MSRFEKFIRRLSLRVHRAVCNHEFQADNQITFVRCKKCFVVYFYEKGVDLSKGLGVTLRLEKSIDYKNVRRRSYD